MNNGTEQIFILNPSVSHPSTTQQKEAEIPSTNQVNLESVTDFSTVCRTCATITEYVIPIFSGEGLQNNLADKIHKHLPIQVTEQDELPRAVCYQCAHTLLAWTELVACCEQADTALRTRLRQITVKQAQDLNPSRPDQGNVIENKEQTEFEEIVDFVVPALDPNPPVYEAPAPSLKTCEYCPTQHSQDSFKDHLISTHSDLLFHCDNCDTYVDKRDFILHMSVHAGQYTSDNVNSETKDTQKKVKKVKKRKEIKDENENTETVQKIATESSRKLVKFVAPSDKDSAAEAQTTNDAENEFSDHSDTEYGFGPLPESVFEAIEDSQDSQLIDSEPTQTLEAVNDPVDSNLINEESPKKQSAKKHKRSRTCQICSKVYTASSSYFYHMKYSHKLNKDHECSVCGRKFVSKSGLNQHMNIHSVKCDFECKYCGKKFRSNASLYIHEQTHNGVKIYSCNQCNISFRWRTHLMRHMKRHSAEKTHVCTTCGRGFAIHCDLLRHARTHTAGDFKCEKCGIKFAQLRYLKVHVLKKHSAQNQIKS